jgi:hypothetical protein
LVVELVECCRETFGVDVALADDDNERLTDDENESLTDDENESLSSGIFVRSENMFLFADLIALEGCMMSIMNIYSK